MNPIRSNIVSMSLLAALGLCAVTAFADEFTFKAQNGTMRRVQRLAPDVVNQYMGGSTVPWNGTYVQGNTDPLFPNGCGAVAGRNLLSWNGMDPPGDGVWRTFEADMAINKAAKGIDVPLGCTALCLKFVGMPGCTVACMALVMDAGNKGARQSGFVNAMARWAPPGKKMFFHAHRNSPEVILSALREGNPPVAVINTAPKVNHFVVVTGMYKDSAGRLTVRLANNANLDWATFERKWSRIDFGNNFERSVMDEVVGEKPYFLAWYSNAMGRDLGKYCMAHHECLSGLCDTRPGAGCVPNRNGTTGQICTDHAQCTSRICSVAPGSVVGACALPGSLNLGQPCNAHEACRTRRCDNRQWAGCVNQDGQGATNDFCTTHQQCRSGACLLNNPISGKCR
ncbi:MAG TPA: hypothetical protein PLI95_18475 [Polyangiaceae bacterium]|nr:hypothetical protein [Polyangiaceae bacterium]